ncbi:hypothetical protein ACLBWT_16980 [Paenibacillus sp. D51F]
MNPNHYPPSGQRNTPASGPPSQGGIFPGLGNSFPFQHMPQQSLFAPMPSSSPSLMPSGPATSIGPLATLEAAAPAAKGGLFSLDKLSDIKGFVDRIGGLDGILGTMTKAQKIIGSFQQMAPLMKVMMGSFGKKGSDKSKLVNLEDDDWKPSKKRRKNKKRRPSGSRKRKGGSAKGSRSRNRRRRKGRITKFDE